MPCIFCGTQENLTEEHVFPAFSGCDLVVRDGSCVRCNGLCSQFENWLAATTETARHIFEIPNRYGRVPKAAVKVEVEGTEIGPLPGRRAPDGELEIYDFVEQTQIADGRKVREGFFVSEESARRFIERSQARGEKTTDLEMPKDVVLLANSQQTLEFAFTPEAHRAAAKIALMSIAHQYGTEYALAAQFDSLRQSIFGPADRLPVRIFVNRDFANTHLRTPQQHSVMAYLSAGMHKGWALVTLFGGLSYVVELTREFAERESRRFSLFYDVGLRRVYTPVVLFDEYELIGRVLSPATVFEEPEAVDAQMYPIVEQYCRQNGLELSRIAAD